MANAWIISTTAQVSALVEVGRRLGGTVTIVSVGERPYSGVDAVITVPLPAGTPAEAAAPAVADAVAAAPGDLVLAANRPADRVLAGAVAARLGAPVLTNIEDLADGGIVVSRFGGIAAETVRVAGPAVIVMAGGNEIDGPAVAASVADGALLPAAITDQATSQAGQVNLGSAKRIVSVGRGFKAADDLGLARALATALGAELSCSRPIAEGVNWLPKDSYVGVSGQSVKPDVYLAVGISGQLQHMAGVRDAKTIVAINSDENAPIFAQADYGVVGDLYAVLPALTAALK